MHPESNSFDEALEKAKKLAVGTITKRKGGRWKKTGPHSWEMLKEIVRHTHTKDGVHPNDATAKTMQSAASKLAAFLVKNGGAYNSTYADKFLDEQFSHLGYRRFGLWKNRVKSSVEKYFKELQALDVGDHTHVRQPSEQLSKLEQWKEKKNEAFAKLLTDAERDDWVSLEFRKSGKNIAHLLYASREIIGRETHMSMVGSSGFKGLCKSIIEKAYEHGPSGLSKDSIKTFEKAFKTMFSRPEGGKIVPLAKALSLAHTNKVFKENPKWFVYCCTRSAMKNDGMVDIEQLPRYILNAKKFHGSKNPPAPDYDSPSESAQAHIRLGLLKPQEAAKKMKQEKPSIVSRVKETFFKLKRKK